MDIWKNTKLFSEAPYVPVPQRDWFGEKENGTSI